MHAQNNRWLPALWLGLALGVAPSGRALQAASLDVHGVASIGSAANHVRSDAFTESLDKSPFGLATPAARLVLQADMALPGDLQASIVADADTQRSSVADVQEAFLLWRPVPQGPWRWRVQAGAFFPVTSLEVGYEQPGWNAERTLSSSAINSWISQELRIIGAELELQWRGAMIGSPNTFTLRAGTFGFNDPAGTEIAWRGWDVSGRITGLFQKLRLPDLPVYRPDGEIPRQVRDVHVFRELDDRPGFYGTLGYEREGRFALELMHYDNRADPLVVEKGQYGWRTEFDHASLRVPLAQEWELLAQGMHGYTLMGPNAVHVQFASWYLLASRTLGPGRVTARYDWFATNDRDILPADAGRERGHAWALAYLWQLPHSLTLVTEALHVQSNRDSRVLLGESPRKVENSLALELRWRL